mmetsp:Transcript_4751/g.15856  ORF Transcript_4751/g.15856 Transcript_4751/m.15856 type:complete len:238 (-) Transcript_4751:662-1375(-)
MNTTKNTRKLIRTPNIFIMSHLLDDTEFKYFSSCVCALSTLATDCSTFSSMRMARSPCSATMDESCAKIPPSSVIVLSTFCSASLLELMYISWFCISNCCWCWFPFPLLPVRWPSKDCDGVPNDDPYGYLVSEECTPPSVAANRGKFALAPPVPAKLPSRCRWNGFGRFFPAPETTESLLNILRRSFCDFTFSERIVNTSLNDFVAPISLCFRVSTTVTEWSWPCLVDPPAFDVNKA